DKIVGGKITPVTYTINKKLLIPGINSFRVVIHRQKLSNRQIIKLAELCQKIEKLFKYSQDIEWAFAKGKFYILQSRPITTFVGNWGAGLDYLLKDCWNGLDKIVEDNFYGRHNKKLITSLSAKVFLALNEAVLIMKKYGDWVKKAKVIKEFGASAKSLNARVIFIDAVTQFLRETSMGAVKIVKVNKAKTTDKKTATEDIKGVVASAGKLVAVNGTAKIIFREDDFSKIKKGDILITKETSSDFLPAIIKAKAIVTDLGGILCHAAIVARELKKPCIVGTKIATQVLKDGDSIEVDLKNGTVYKR
ncbi:MAG: phosphoenolpyruvate synthase, partial [Candidatus Azambacteria bacterium GW2011_GWE1_42_9]